MIGEHQFEIAIDESCFFQAWSECEIKSAAAGKWFKIVFEGVWTQRQNHLE